MSSPKFFGDFGKTTSDLFSKDYDLKQPTLEIKTKTSNPKSALSAKFESENGKIDAELTDKVTCKRYGTFKVVLNSCPKKQPTLEFENSSLVDGLSIKVKSQFLGSSKVTAKYKRDAVACDTELSYDPNGDKVCVKPSFVFARDCFSLGASALLTPTDKESAFNSYEFGAEYTKNSLVGTAKILKSCETLQLSMSHQVSPATLFGLSYCINPSSFGDQSITAGGTYQMNPVTSVKGKLASTGILTTLFTRNVSDSVTLAVSAEADIRNYRKLAPSLGLKLVLGE